MRGRAEQIRGKAMVFERDVQAIAMAKFWY